MIPFTLVAMGGVNAKLMSEAAALAVGGEAVLAKQEATSWLTTTQSVLVPVEGVWGCTVPLSAITLDYTQSLR